MVAGIPARGMPGFLLTAPPSGDSAGPSLFSAVQQRLGLKRPTRTQFDTTALVRGRTSRVTRCLIPCGISTVMLLT